MKKKWLGVGASTVLLICVYCGTLVEFVRAIAIFVIKNKNISKMRSVPILAIHFVGVSSYHDLINMHEHP